MKYTIPELSAMLEHLNLIFDMVRIVDTKKCKEMSIKDNKLIVSDKSCFEMWNANKRCDYCISNKASRLNERLSRFEFRNNLVYYLIANPLEITTDNGILNHLVLELATINTDKIFVNNYGKCELVENISTYEEKIYTDSLTKAYNRRYYEEDLFYFSINNAPTDEVTFIVADLKNFKYINDTYGHSEGDKLLAHVVDTIKKCIRSDDTIIRMGGDEFLIILPSCSIEVTKRIINTINKTLIKNISSEIDYTDKEIINFGISHTDKFIFTDTFTDSLYREADKQMYVQKRNK